MKKLALLTILIISPILLSGATKLPVLSQGLYSGKLMNISNDEFFGKEYFFQSENINRATFTESKPEEITINPTIDIKKPMYGNISLGDNGKKIYFVMTQDNQGYWSEFYI